MLNLLLPARRQKLVARLVFVGLPRLVLRVTPWVFSGAGALSRLPTAAARMLKSQSRSGLLHPGVSVVLVFTGERR
ncbi:hypothetical protein [Microbacterium sp.]|uniref:hypothetical protein n=1 Tax=Microbacterium sp. TaxID=51671 RepID=UPI002810CFF3|nr:hypothetical protein [Microbacterium sp.]